MHPSQSNAPQAQRKAEWEKMDAIALDYHKSQWSIPKESTRAFLDFAKEKLAVSRNVIDLRAGAGGATAQIAQRFGHIAFTAFDYSQELVDIGAALGRDASVENLRFVQGDWYDIEKTNEFDGCISLQTISWLPGFEKPLQQIFEKISPRWIAISSLFYEGDISCRIEVNEHSKDKKSFYNVYSIPEVARFCQEHGYQLVKFIPFEIGIDLAKPANIDSMGTYTQRIESAGESVKRLQFSGPVFMNWHMLMIEKQE